MKFRFERIKEVKEKLMEEKEREIQTVLSEIENITDNIVSIDKNIADNYKDITSATLDSNDFCNIKEYIIFLDHKKLVLLEQKETLKDKVNILRSELVEMLKEVKMLETLKQKEAGVAKKYQNRKEQKVLDDIALRIGDKKE